MRTKRALYLCVSVITLAACYKEPEKEPEETLPVKRAVILRAVSQTLQDEETGISLSGPDMVWLGTESIHVLTSEGENTRFTADNEGSAVTFSGDSLFGKPMYAFYPYADINSFDGSIITFSLPKVQTYAYASFDQGANAAIGTIDQREGDEGVGNIVFKNLCGYVKISLSLEPGDGSTRVDRLVLTDPDKVLSGTFTVDADADEPLAVYLEDADDGTHSIILDIPDSKSVVLSDSQVADFYFVVPPGTCLDNYMVDVYNCEGHLIKRILYNHDTPVKRNHVRIMPPEVLSWLPKGYLECKYIQSTDYQPVNTGVPADAEFSMRMRMSLTEIPKEETDYTYCVPVGVWDETDAVWIRFQYQPGGVPADVRYLWTHRSDCAFSGDYFGRGASFFQVEKVVDIEWINKLAERRITVDDASLSHSSTLDAVPTTMSYPLYLFSANYMDTYGNGYPTKMKLYEAVFFDGADNIVRNFVPAYRESDGAYGLYEASETAQYEGSFFYTAVNGKNFSGHRLDEDPTLVFSSFRIEGGEILTITEDNLIVVCVPHGADLSNLVAVFETNAQEVLVNDQPQLSGVTSNDFSTTVTYRLLSSEGVNYYRVKVYDFELPTVWLATADGSDISSKTEWENAFIAIFDGTTINLQGATQVRGRGNSTWGMEKNPYTLKLDSKASVLGLNGKSKDKRWNLLANYFDRSRIRNDLALEVAHRSPGIEWSPYGTFVELILNGEHKGNYYLCEHNKISKNRVNVVEQDEDEEKANPSGFDYSGGYLLEFDDYFDETNRFHSALCGFPVNLKSPDWEGYDMTYIRNWINSLEAKLSREDMASSDYRDYLDMDSYIDYWFVFELLGNEELVYPKSAYMYKDRDVSPYKDSKIHAGPVWDFDLCLLDEFEGWIAKNTLWYPLLFRDPAFVARVKEKWNAQKAHYQDVADNYINTLSARVKESVERDMEMWEHESYDGQLTFDEIVARIKSIITHRIFWMDTEINSW